jgi:N-glycosylase/DNA lyase
VADCVILFGLHNRRAFPVDVWIERVIARKYAGVLDTSKYGEMAGIVQQYMFYYAINHRGEFV